MCSVLLCALLCLGQFQWSHRISNLKLGSVKKAFATSSRLILGRNPKLFGIPQLSNRNELSFGMGIRRESQMVRCASTQKFGTKETAHALVGGRVGTAVVVLVGMQSGFPARGVLREHGRPLGVARARSVGQGRPCSRRTPRAGNPDCIPTNNTTAVPTRPPTRACAAPFMPNERIATQPPSFDPPMAGSGPIPSHKFLI